LLAVEKTNNQEELAEFYTIADVFVICSKQENFPTVCIEALSCGTPVVGFNNGGSSETAPNPIGEFVQDGDLDSLRRAIINHYKTPELSMKCITYSKEHYSKKVMYSHYLELYNNLLKNA
jgi:glycosyltransferase involved in cell wall biosynthesis